MSKYFDNINTQVTRGNFGSNYGRQITDKNLIPVKDRKKENKQEALMESSKKHMELSKQAQRMQIDKIKNQREFRKVLNESYDKIKDDLFCNILHHICLEALCIDEQPMYENMENITNRINKQYEDLGGFKAIKEQAKKTNNVLLERMIVLCENTAKKVADRNMKEAQSADEFKFELNDEEKNEFEYNKDNINIDSIANKIKEKVIKVVSDEKEANNKKTEIMDEIEDKLKEDDVDEETTEEAMEFIFNENIETTTLFEALMRDCYKITLETPNDLIFESYIKEECDDDSDDPEYKMSELDSFDDNNVMNDEVAEDLMISESFTHQFSVQKLKELENYLSEGVKLRARPGNLGLYSDYDTGVADIIQSAKKREHIAKSILQPGFRESIMNLIKSAKHGPDVAYINQLAKLPNRLFSKNGKVVRTLENYTEWLNTEYKEAYLEAVKNLGFNVNESIEFKQNVVSYEPISNVFKEHASSIIEAVQDGDYEQLDKNLKHTSKDIKKVAEDCDKSKKNLMSCKESIREIQKSTEDLKDESKNNKSAKEACSAKTIAKSKKDLSEMLVCPICEKDPCECESVCPKCGKDPCKCESMCPKCGKDPCKCESDELLNEYTINSNINSNVNRKVYSQRVDAYGSINYNKLAAAGAVAAGAGAVYGKYKLDENKVKKLCQREVGYNGKLAGWQKKIMKRIKKAKKGKDIIEVKITVKNDINALQKGLKKNPEYKMMVANQIKWYNDVAMKGILAKEREFNIAEDFEYEFDVDEGYLFEDYYEDTEDVIFEDSDIDDDDAEDEDIKKYLKEEDDDDDDIVEESSIDKIVDKFASRLDKRGARKDIGKYDKMKEDMTKAISKVKKDKDLDNMNSVIQAASSSLQQRIDFMKQDDSFTKENIKEVEGYLRWLKSEVPRLIKSRKKEILKESLDYIDILEEGLKDKFINIKQKEIQNIKKSTLKRINKIKSEKNMLNVVDEIGINIETLKTASSVYNRKNEDGKYDNILEDIDEMINWLDNDAKDLAAAQYKKVSESLCLESSKFVCRSCGYVTEEAPEYCPECGNDGDQFQLMEGFGKNYINNMKNLPKALKGISKDARKVTARNIGTMLVNGIKAKGDINKTHDGLLKMVNSCKNVKEVEYLQKELSSAKVTLKTKINNAKNDEEKEALKQHAKWLSSEYSKALTEKKKQLKTAVKEQADFEQDFLYGKDRALYENYSNSDMPKPSKMRQYCLLKKIDEATSFEDLDRVKEYIQEETKQYKHNKEYVNWLTESAINAIVLKHVVLEENVVIESFLDSLDDVCDMLDERLDRHDEAKQAALESLYVNFDGKNVFAPVFKANDVNSNNIEFAYKVKFLCEGLKGLMFDCENIIDLTQAERLIQRNMDSINTIMESLDSTSYKYNTLNSATRYLQKICDRIPGIKDLCLMESYDVEYDEEILTEAVNLTDELYDNAVSDDIMYNTKNSHMDVIMAEAITKYTIMETFNTIRLTNLTNQDIEKIVRNIVK